MKVLAVVRTLEEAGILSTTESVYSPSTLFLNRASEETFRNRDSESEFAKFLLSLVRNYEGLFSHQVKISEEKISRFSGLEIEKVFKFLKNLTELGYGEYSPRSELPRILFLCNRVEAKSLSIDYVKIEQLFKWKWSKLETMISFVNSDSCRESKILNYFSEKTSKKCGRCDICKGSSKDSFKVSELDDLYSYLKSKNLKRIDLYDVLHWWPHNKRRKVLAMLSILENENRISIKNKNLELV